MRCRKLCLGLVILLCVCSSAVLADDYDLQYFLAKVSSKEGGLSRSETAELLNRIEGVMGKAQKIREKLAQRIQAGEVDVRYQEGKFWISKLDEDGGTIDTAIQQIKLLRDRPTLLVPSARLYKSLRDLTWSLNVYNTIPSFSSLVGDLAPEAELWADPVFYQLYLLPLAHARDKEMEPKPPPTEKVKKPAPKVKKP